VFAVWVVIAVPVPGYRLNIAPAQIGRGRAAGSRDFAGKRRHMQCKQFLLFLQLGRLRSIQLRTHAFVR
jgi:hypothetical protein